MRCLSEQFEVLVVFIRKETISEASVVGNLKGYVSKPCLFPTLTLRAVPLLRR